MDQRHDDPHNDTLLRFSFDHLPVRGQWVRLHKVVEDATRHRTYPPSVLRLLASQFAAVSMFADNLKFQGAVALQSKGLESPLIRSLAECRDQQFLRGIAHLDPEQASPTNPADLREWLGGGQLALSLIPTGSGQPYQGLIEQRHATLASNLESYFEQSEQLPTRLFFAHTDTPSVTGLLIQRLPEDDLATEIASSTAEEGWQTISALVDTLQEQELASLAPAELLNRLFHELPCRIYPTRPLSFRCTCSRAKSDRTLRVLPEDDLRSLLDERGSIEVDCEFCGTRYDYDAVDISALLHQATTGNPQSH